MALPECRLSQRRAPMISDNCTDTDVGQVAAYVFKKETHKKSKMPPRASSYVY
jgi:hypothetical protein